MKTTTNDQLLLPLELFAPAAAKATAAAPAPQPAAPARPEPAAPAAPEDVIFELMGDYGKVIKSIFDCMETAEQEIADAQRRYPKQSDKLWNTFHLLTPSELLRPRNTFIYSYHAYEILERIANGQEDKIGQPTDAELLCLFSQASLRAPLNQLGTRCYYELFCDFYADELDRFWDYEPREDWPGQAKQMIQMLKEKPSLQQKRNCRK
jgi:hypothetical protein